MLLENSTNRLTRAEETEDLLNEVQKLIVPFIRCADEDNAFKISGRPRPHATRNALVEPHAPQDLFKLFDLNLPEGDGRGKRGLLGLIEETLKYSVNTWDQGFMDKLCASTNPVGVISELILAVLNTNVHVYHVSPALTVIEKLTANRLAKLFGMSGQFAGGISTQGGSASNATALLIARNTLYPDTKTHGNQNHRFAIFTSAHSHYSIEKAAQMVGFGSNAVKLVPADSAGCMISSELARLVQKSLEDGETPLFINATAGTTVLGAFDPIVEISQISKRHQLWLHVDGSWGGSTIFSKSHNHKLVGSHVADSLAINPHKMLGVPVTCSFLLGPDLRVFKAANTLPAAYLFHDIDTVQNADQQPGMWDIADLTLQCGRRGDSLKLALSWIYYGASGFEAQIDNAFRIATYLASLVVEHQDLVLVSSYPPPCLQVCFYFALNGRLQSQEDNSRTTKRVVKGLVHRGFMIDYAPGHSGVMFRAVINTQTQESTAKGLIVAILEESRTQTS